MSGQTGAPDDLQHCKWARPSLTTLSTGLLSVPKVKKKSGCGAFFYRASFLRNNLPADIRQSDSIEAFQSKLKIQFFASTFN